MEIAQAQFNAIKSLLEPSYKAISLSCFLSLLKTHPCHDACQTITEG